MEQIDLIKRLCDEYPDYLGFVKSADEASNVFSSNKGKKYLLPWVLKDCIKLICRLEF